MFNWSTTWIRMVYMKYSSQIRQLQSTETALLRVQNDIIQAVDSRGGAILVLLYLSAAFDTIDHRKTCGNILYILWHKGRSSQMVVIISESPYSICMNRIYFISRTKSVVWCSPNLSPGASTFHNLHNPSWKYYPEALVNIPPICWWHSALYGIQTIWRDIQLWCCISDRGLRGRHTDIDEW